MAARLGWFIVSGALPNIRQFDGPSAVTKSGAALWRGLSDYPFHWLSEGYAIQAFGNVAGIKVALTPACLHANEQRMVNGRQWSIGITRWTTMVKRQ